MKRFAWLLLLAFCTALAQVQPVDAPVTKMQDCGCCEAAADTCGPRDCAPAPASGQPALTLQSAATVLRIEARRISPAPRVPREPFYVQFLPRPAVQPAAVASAVAAPAASVPLFRAHCSFLI